MLLSIGMRQLGHVRRTPRDLERLPLFVLQLTFVMVPIRIAAFATMFHQGWTSRPTRSTTANARPTMRERHRPPDGVAVVSSEPAQ